MGSKSKHLTTLEIAIKSLVTDEGIDIPNYNLEQINNLISNLAIYVQDSASVPFDDDILFLMITHALQSAVNKQESEAVQSLCKILSQFIKKDEQAALNLISKKIDIDPYKDQSFAFTWMDQLYSVVLTKDVLSLISLNYLLTQLVTTEGKLFVDLLLTPQVSGKNEGMNALVPLTLALLNTANEKNELPSSMLLVNLLILILQRDPSANEILFQPIQHHSFSGQSILTFLAKVVELSVKNNPRIVMPLINQLLRAIQEQPESLVIDSVTRTIERGPDAGLTTLHCIVQALSSAAHTKEAHNEVHSLNLLLSTIYNRAPDLLSAVMVQPITTGDSLNQNAVILLSKALLAAVDNKYDINPFIELLERIVAEQGEEKIYTALQEKVKYQATTYFQMLHSFVARNANNPDVDRIKEFLTNISKNSQNTPPLPHPSNSTLTVSNKKDGLFSERVKHNNKTDPEKDNSNLSVP